MYAPHSLRSYYTLHRKPVLVSGCRRMLPGVLMFFLILFLFLFSLFSFVILPFGFLLLALFPIFLAFIAHFMVPFV